MRRTVLLFMSGLFLLTAVTCDAQILHKKRKKTKAPATTDENVQPDKILYDRAMGDVKHGRYDSGRLNLQTLINTYPDSEYLAKAKMSIADAYFKEGGSPNMTLAIAGYKDFIVFFPFLPEAAYAQKQVAMAHYNQMQKPDRDRTEAKLAEEEFQTFLQKYPNDALAANAEQRLREVQEVLAEGEYRIGYYYYVKGDPRAAASRLLSVTQRYPLYSRCDHALWMLGDIFEKSEHKDVAAAYYSQILRNYPKSGMVGVAKNRLVAFNVPVPQPDPQAMARMTADQNTPRPRESLIKRPMGLFKNGPGTELRAAARVGAPNMQPESASPGTDILTGGGAPRLGGGGSGSGTGIVATVTPGTAGSTENSGTATDGNSANPPAAAEGNSADSPAPASSDAPASTEANTADSAPTASNAAVNTAAPTGDGAAKTGSPNSSSTDSANAANTDNSQNSSPSSSGKESSSKKKKGLRKIVPW